MTDWLAGWLNLAAASERWGKIGWRAGRVLYMMYACIFIHGARGPESPPLTAHSLNFPLSLWLVHFGRDANWGAGPPPPSLFPWRSTWQAGYSCWAVGSISHTPSQPSEAWLRPGGSVQLANPLHACAAQEILVFLLALPGPLPQAAFPCLQAVRISLWFSTDQGKDWLHLHASPDQRHRQISARKRAFIDPTAQVTDKM
jgi:hypothetical protein